MSTLTDFVNRYYPDALRASQKTGINADVILAQAALESGWGTAAPGNNLFGVKGPGSTQTTKEFINGKWVTIKDSFKGYASKSASFDGYADFINANKRYSGVSNVTTSSGQVMAIANAGYATDPAYAQKVGGIAGQIRNSFSGLNLSGQDYANQAMKNLLPQSWQDWLGGDLANVLVAPGNAIDSAVESVTPDWNTWFQRAALAVFALIFIAAAVFAFKGGDAINTMAKVKGLAA